MISKVSSNNAFCGMLSQDTVKLAAKQMGKKGEKMAKNFRAGENKFDKISVIYETRPICDAFYNKKPAIETLMQVHNPKSKKTPIRVPLKNGFMPFGEKMLELITEKMDWLQKAHLKRF